LIKIDCSELSGSTRLSLAFAVSDGLGGEGVALLRDNGIVIDELSGHGATSARVQAMVESFFSELEDAASYRVEGKDETVVVHSTKPVSEQDKKTPSLPPGFIQCPVCGFLTTSEGKYQTHLRMHDFMRGLAR
jgi:hypothetical protein